MTKAQAVELYDSGFWKSMSHHEIALFQLHEKLLCMPFGVFHEAVEKAIGRPVYTHEFARPDGLKSELLGKKERPSLQEILDLIPEEKRIIVSV